MVDDLKRTGAYMDRAGAAEGHLVIFKPSEGARWQERVFQACTANRGRTRCLSTAGWPESPCWRFVAVMGGPLLRELDHDDHDHVVDRHAHEGTDGA